MSNPDIKSFTVCVFNAEQSTVEGCVHDWLAGTSRYLVVEMKQRVGLPGCDCECLCMYVCVVLFVSLPGRVLITRCWSGNLSVVSSSVLVCRGRAGPRQAGLGLAGLRVLSPWRRPTVTFHLCSVRPSVSLSPFLLLVPTVSACVLVVAAIDLAHYYCRRCCLQLLQLLARLRQFRPDRIVTLFCRSALQSRRHETARLRFAASVRRSHDHSPCNKLITADFRTEINSLIGQCVVYEEAPLGLGVSGFVRVQGQCQ